MEITIKEGEERHAPYIARAIIMAIGDDLAIKMAGENHTVEEVKEMFTRLARRKDSQYSYLNTLVAETEDGKVAGLTISYDGAELHKLRRAFFEEARSTLGWDIDPDNLDHINDETGPEEFYLDSFAVFPEFQGKRIGSRLVEATEKKGKKRGKPLGLLCSMHNNNSRKIYDHLGFKKIGERFFAGELMDHMIK